MIDNAPVRSTEYLAKIIVRECEQIYKYNNKEGQETEEPDEARRNRLGELEVVGVRPTYKEKQRKKPVIFDITNPVEFNAAIEELASFHEYVPSQTEGNRFNDYLNASRAVDNAIEILTPKTDEK